MSRIWFGTRQRATWIRAFAPGITYQPVGFMEKLNYLNGGVGIRQSNNYHMEYTLAWPNATRDAVRTITDYAVGIKGPGPVYWVDLLAKDKNLFNMGWSAPALGGLDAVPLIADRRPNLVTNPDASRDYPAQMGSYDVLTTDTTRSFYTPIPPGYTAWVGAHGTESAQGLSVRATAAGVLTGPVTSVPVLSVADPTRFSHSFPGGAQSGIEISLDNSADATITLAGLILQILPTGTAPKTGDFISGQGHSGCRFEGVPASTPYYLGSDGRESIGLSGKLTEIGDWL